MQWYEAEVRQLIARLAAEPVVRPRIVSGSPSIRLWSTIAQDLGSDEIVNAESNSATDEAH